MKEIPISYEGMYFRRPETYLGEILKADDFNRIYKVINIRPNGNVWCLEATKFDLFIFKFKKMFKSWLRKQKSKLWRKPDSKTTSKPDYTVEYGTPDIRSCCFKN